MIYSLVLLGALAVAALGLWVRQRSSVMGQAMIGLGIIGSGLCIVGQVRQTLFPPDAAGPDRGQAVVGYYLANQVLSEMGDQQGAVVLLFPPESVIDADTVGTYAGTFARVLRGFPGLKVEVVTLEAPGKAAKAGRINGTAFQAAAAKAPAALAYVSFAGVPAEIEKLAVDRSPSAKFFVFDPWGTTNWLGALKAGRVRSAIVPRPGARRAAGSEISGEPQEVFQRLYLMATPATADAIARELTVGPGRATH